MTDKQFFLLLTVGMLFAGLCAFALAAGGRDFLAIAVLLYCVIGLTWQMARIRK